jgi:spastin
MNPKSSDP